MANDNVILRFNKVDFDYSFNKSILNEASFSVRRGSKLALMGQNGAGKSTIFNLITKTLKPEGGALSTDREISIAVSRQVIPRDQLDFSVREFFESV
ncbi:MAG: ATP-binding cassette domain-containing protein, partial [Patescibacteria group bacterium]